MLVRKSYNAKGALMRRRGWVYQMGLVCAGLMGFTMVAGCGHAIKVTRVGTETQTDLSGNWNDTDARLTAQSLIQECFASAWLPDFVTQEGRKPTIRVRRIINKTDEHIDAQVFVKSIERAMVNSGKVRVLAQAGAEQEAIRSEQDDAASGVQSDESSVSVGNEAGADYVVAVRMASILDQVQGKRAKFYKINFELLQATTGEKAWIGDYEIKKLITQAGARW